MKSCLSQIPDPGTHDYITSQGNRLLCGWEKSQILRWRDFPGLSGSPMQSESSFTVGDGGGRREAEGAEGT